MSPSFPVDPVHPPAPYIGGKRALAGRIIERINATPHDGYAESFVGMGGVFFRRDQRPKTEVINDINGEVANLFRILQRHYPQFMEPIDQRSARRPGGLLGLQAGARLAHLHDHRRQGHAGQGADHHGLEDGLVPVLRRDHGATRPGVVEKDRYDLLCSILLYDRSMAHDRGRGGGTK